MEFPVLLTTLKTKTAQLPLFLFSDRQLDIFESYSRIPAVAVYGSVYPAQNTNFGSDLRPAISPCSSDVQRY